MTRVAVVQQKDERNLGTSPTLTRPDPMWPVDDIFVPPVVITLLCRDNLSTYSLRAFAVAGPAAWNSLSDDLRDPALSTDSFRRVLKTRLFSEY